MHPKRKARLLRQLGFPSADAALREFTLLTAATQLAQFREECARFEKKYRMSLDAFERRLKKECGHERFEAEEDLMAWRFAHEGMEYWAPRVEELRRAV
ncbi:hypothetical protein L6Q96_20030 [Candidatus Binatia bacterium]|nr:hypothetical protein [Candidatus Binatia bacterium]